MAWFSKPTHLAPILPPTALPSQPSTPARLILRNLNTVLLDLQRHTDQSPSEMLTNLGGHNTVPLQLATCFSHPSSSASFDNFHFCRTPKWTPISQDPVPFPFFIQAVGVCEGKVQAALAKPEISKLSLAVAPWRIS